MDEAAPVPSYAELMVRQDAPAGSAWKVFGESDEVGTLNFLTPTQVMAGIQSVRKGKVFALDYPLDAFPIPVRFRPPPEHVILRIGKLADGSVGILAPGAQQDPRDPVILDDYVDGFFPQVSSHIDSLRHHAHPEHGFYNGHPSNRMIAGDPCLGISRWAERGIVGRAVLIDVAAYRREMRAPLNHVCAEAIGPELLCETLDWQGTELRAGDMILLRTDYPAYLRTVDDSEELARRSAGLAQTRAMVGWLWDNRVALIAADNPALERMGGAQRSEFGAGHRGRLHDQLIPLLGIAIGELWYLDDLAADCAYDGVYAFLLVVKPIHQTGGVGSPANATAVK